jgi:hypothetical protein
MRKTNSAKMMKTARPQEKTMAAGCEMEGGAAEAGEAT